MFVLTVDQRHSRRTADRVEALLRDLAPRAGDLVRPFERTAGDEVQAVVERPDVVVDLTLLLVRDRAWSVGVGIGPVDQPLPASTRAGSGPAFSHARAAVTAAKSRSTGLAVVGADEAAARRAQTALDLVAALLQRRTDRGVEAAALAREGLSQLEVARRLGVTKQAVSQRLQAADWYLEAPGRELAAYLLSAADGTVDRP
jgi:DNA-binding CsgD family transcriptional regulator